MNNPASSGRLWAVGLIALFVCAFVYMCVDAKLQDKLFDLCKTQPWLVGIILFFVLVVIYTYFDMQHQEVMWRCAMEHGYEQKPAGFMGQDRVWVRVVCKHCGGKAFVSDAEADILSLAKAGENK